VKRISREDEKGLVVLYATFEVVGEEGRELYEVQLIEAAL